MATCRVCAALIRMILWSDLSRRPEHVSADTIHGWSIRNRSLHALSRRHMTRMGTSCLCVMVITLWPARNFTRKASCLTAESGYCRRSLKICDSVRSLKFKKRVLKSLCGHYTGSHGRTDKAIMPGELKFVGMIVVFAGLLCYLATAILPGAHSLPDMISTIVLAFLSNCRFFPLRKLLMESA